MSVGGATMEAVLLPPQSQSHRRCHGAELSPQRPSPNLSLEFCHRPRIFFSEGHGDLLHIWINLCSQKSLPFMFKGYMQTSTDHARKYGATWLVLAICMQLAELMDGTQTVVSNENEGSTLKLSQGFHYQWYRRFLCFQAKSTTFSSVPIATNLMV